MGSITPTCRRTGEIAALAQYQLNAQLIPKLAQLGGQCGDEPMGLYQRKVTEQYGKVPPEGRAVAACVGLSVPALGLSVCRWRPRRRSDSSITSSWSNATGGATPEPLLPGPSPHGQPDQCDRRTRRIPNGTWQAVSACLPAAGDHSARQADREPVRRVAALHPALAPEPCQLADLFIEQMLTPVKVTVTSTAWALGTRVASRLSAVG